MAYDGHLKFDTSVDGKGFQQGISTLAKGAAAALTAVSAALGAMAGYAVKVGSDFEAGMSEVAAISGATGDELDALTAKAKEMARAPNSAPPNQLKHSNTWPWPAGIRSPCWTACPAS